MGPPCDTDNYTYLYFRTEYYIFEQICKHTNIKVEVLVEDLLELVNAQKDTHTGRQKEKDRIKRRKEKNLNEGKILNRNEVQKYYE